AKQRETGRLALGCCKGGVAEPAVAAVRNHARRALANEVREHLAVTGLDDGPVGHLENQIRRIGTMTHVACALSTIGCRSVRGVVVIEQRRHLRTHAQNHGTSAPAVAAVGPPEGLELLAVYGRNPVAAVPRRGVEDNAI